MLASPKPDEKTVEFQRKGIFLLMILLINCLRAYFVQSYVTKQRPIPRWMAIAYPWLSILLPMICAVLLICKKVVYVGPQILAYIFFSTIVSLISDTLYLSLGQLLLQLTYAVLMHTGIVLLATFLILDIIDMPTSFRPYDESESLDLLSAFQTVVSYVPFWGHTLSRLMTRSTTGRRE